MKTKTYIFCSTNKDYKVKATSLTAAVNAIFERTTKELGNRYSKSWIKARTSDIN